MKQRTGNIMASKYWWVILLLLLVAINYLGTIVHGRLDLTREKRYTLSTATKKLLAGLDEPVQIDVFLKGEFPAGFKKLAGSAEDFLQLLKDHNGSKVLYQFIAPTDEMPNGKPWGDTLVKMGAVPINLSVVKKAGESSNIIFPVAVLRYKGKEMLVNLYPGANNNISQNEINSAEALLEYQFAKGIDKITNDRKPYIVYAAGNGEPLDYRVWDLEQTLLRDFNFGPIDITTKPIPSQTDILMIVKPTKGFSEDVKLKIDQYVMGGGKLLLFIDNLIAEQDSLQGKAKGETIAYDRDLNLTDQLFRYGVRINTDLVMDLQCDLIPIVVGGTMENPQMEFLHWNYFPFLVSSDNNVSKNIGYVAGRFVNSIDTIEVAGIKKTPLLVTSPNSRIISTPALISLNENKNVPQDIKFNRNAIPAAVLLEGKFTSLFRNKLSKSILDSLGAANQPFQSASADNKMIVVADGDIVLNDVLPDAGPISMGWNKYTYTEYLKESPYAKAFLPVANRDFLLNCVEYLVNNPEISQTRNKDIVLRLLDGTKVNEQKTTWQLVNIALPILLVILAGFIYQQVRKRKYAA
jgi:ABC-2 type transport system permease protein